MKPELSKSRWRSLLETFIPLLALLLLVIATAICERVKSGTSDFLTAGNLLNVLRTQSPMGIVAIGMTFAIISGGIDLSVGSLLAMAGIAGVWVMPHISGDGKAVLVGIMAMIAVALAAGALNGVLIAKGRLAPFIATLGGLAAYRSVAQTVADNGTLNVSSDWFTYLNRGGIPIPLLGTMGHPVVIHFASIAFLMIAGAAAVILNRTRYGRHVFAIGGNERAAAYSAVNVDRVKILTYTLVGLCCGAAAVLVAARQSSMSSADAGRLYELDAIAAVVIGGTRITGGSGTILGTVMGVLILGVINSMLNFLDVPDSLQGLMKGVIIVVAALVQRVGRRGGV